MRTAARRFLPDLTYTLGAQAQSSPAIGSPSSRTRSAKLIRGAQRLRRRPAEPEGPHGLHAAPEHPPRVAFVMSGQGPQWWGMGRELMQHEPVFRKTIERCDAAMRPWARFSLLEELGRTEETSQMHRTEIAQPAIFAMQVALAELWKSWGVQPAAIVGHSVGEIAAACVAGVFSLEEAARVIVLRARFMEDCARGEGTMLAVGLDEEAARALIARHDRTVTISAFNGPRSLTLAGPRLSLEAMAAELEREGFSRDSCRWIIRSIIRYAAGVRGLGRSAGRSQAAGGDGPFFQHRDRPAVRRRSMRRRSLGHAECGNRCSSRPPSTRWRTSASMCGWKSARIPRWFIRSRNASRRAATKAP